MFNDLLIPAGCYSMTKTDTQRYVAFAHLGVTGNVLQNEGKCSHIKLHIYSINLKLLI